MSSAVPRGVRRALQVAGLAAAVWYLVHTARTHWTDLMAVPVTLHPVPLVAGSLLTVLTWFLLVRTWSHSLRWWGESLGFAAAVRIWFITNLSRFVPGAIWQFAHVSAEALSARVSPLAVALSVSLAPVLPTAVTGSTNPALALGLASLGVVAAVIFLPIAAPTLERWTSRLTGREIRWPAPTHRELSRYVGTLALPWVAYGVAFWLFGRAVLGDAAPALLPAAAAFVGSYVAGIIAVFAPGGLGVREAALVALLAPVTGPAPALLLAVASRLWLVALEILTALGVLARRPHVVSTE